MKINSVDELEKLRSEIVTQRNPEQTVISIGNGTCCRAVGSESVADTFIEEIKKRNLKDKFILQLTGCQGFSEQDPVVVIYPKKIFYHQVKPEDVTEILDSIVAGKIVNRLLYENFMYEAEIPFFRMQKRFLTSSFGKINPLSISDYISISGYSALAKALQMNPEEIIDEIKKSGLRGRGGAGFPTGRKWSACRQSNPTTNNQQLTTKYIICNADEGDPGAFMDRSLLESNPHSVIEGMIIGAYAIGGLGSRSFSPAEHEAHKGLNARLQGASGSVEIQGYIYVRNEYPLAVKHLQIALTQAKEYGFLGANILGTEFSFDIKIIRGGGAFVCGESSALRASIEGKIGEPSVKYVHATDKGLYDRPTVLNNVKTWASVPLIVNNGAEWFSSIGTEKSKGTMIFSLVGKINNTGLVEVPMGIKLRQLIYDIGGGIPNNKKFKAVQTGGPSGGCIPESLLDLPVDYEALTEAGSMMGSGGMIVMDEDTCMVEVARYFLAFTQDESCGKCTPCREGTKIMLDILTRITQGKGSQGDIELLEEVGQMVKDTALCALGNSAPNPVLTTIRYFRNEYEAHIKEKKCPAKQCKSLITYSILEKCNGCHVCFKNCPQEAISGEPKKLHTINQDKCIKCGICFDLCKFAAIEIQ
ncbi:MAG: NADH-quinone oxidoreductase subunit NuoF [Elusimicrobiota bacterium]